VEVTGRQREGALTPACFREIFAAMSAAVAVCRSVPGGDDFELLELNPAAEQLCKTTRARAVGRTVTDLLPSAKKLGVLSALHNVHLSGEPVRLGARHYQDASLNMWVEIRLSRLPGGLVLAMFDDVGSQRHLLKALEQSRDKLRGLSLHLSQARERERRSIARELHDSLGQQLTVLSMDVGELESMFDGVGPDAAAAVAQAMLPSMQATLDRALEDLRRLCRDLRPRVLDDLGLVEALRSEAAAFQRRTGTRCRLSLPSEEPNLGESRPAARCFGWSRSA